MAIKSLFSSSIFQASLASKGHVTRLNRELKRDIKILMGMDQDGWKWSEENYADGYTSYGSMTDLHLRYAPFMELKSRIDAQAKRYSRALKWDLQGGRLSMTSCWVNVMPEGSHHSLHLHPLAVVSGTYYVDVPPGSGSLKLEDPRLSLMMASPPRPGLFCEIQPKAGDVLLWESWLRHEVTPHRGRRERISVSFNYEWK